MDCPHDWKIWGLVKKLRCMKCGLLWIPKFGQHPEKGQKDEAQMEVKGKRK